MANRPKPTALKLLNGNPGKRALPKSEPTPRTGTPERPAALDATAAAAWDSIAPELEAMGVLTLADAAALEALCTAFADWRAACETIREQGATYETQSPKGDLMLRPHPAQAQKSDADKRLRAWLAEFGLTPAARAKLAGGKNANAPADPFDNY